MFDPNRGFAASYTDVTPADDADVAKPLIGLNISAAGLVKITTVGTANAPSWTGTIHVVEGDNGTAPIKRLWEADLTATIEAGIL